MRSAIWSVAVLLAAAACGADPPGDSPTTITETPTTVTTTPGITQPEDRLDQAVADLAGRLRVGPEEIEVIRFEEITWSDGSLGCPQPGMSYTQALVDGYRAVLGHDDRVYLYHGGPKDPLFLCESDEDDGGYDFVPPPGIDV